MFAHKKGEKSMWKILFYDDETNTCKLKLLQEMLAFRKRKNIKDAELDLLGLKF